MNNMELIDTHCHLYLDEFRDDLPELMLRADQEGVTKIYMPGLDSHHTKSVLALADRYPMRCFAMTGLHPCYVKENYAEELEWVEESLANRPFAAVGEIGLDYYWDRSFDEYQQISFRRQIGMAKRYDLPVVIHSRNSMDDCIQILKQERTPSLSGIFHCFSGTLEQAEEIIACGMMLGIGGVVTYKNAGLAKVVAALPLEHIVLETDAPYLTPVPFRGKRNESSYLKYILARVAALKDVPMEEVARITTANANRVFPGHTIASSISTKRG